jgi:thioredoxin 1
MRSVLTRLTEKKVQMSSVTKLNDADLDRIKQNGGITLLDFYADWCGPCKALAPTLERFASENPHITVGKINVDENSNTAEEFGIRGIPTLVFLHDGREVGRLVGATSQRTIQDLLNAIKAGWWLNPISWIHFNLRCIWMNGFQGIPMKRMDPAAYLAERAIRQWRYADGLTVALVTYAF